MAEEFDWKTKLQSFDQYRDIIIAGETQETISFCVHQWLQIAQTAIQKYGVFTVALSGGQTPHAIFKELSRPQYHDALNWSKVLCFWSDERYVPRNHPDNNYFTAMQSGLRRVPLSLHNIFPIPTENDIETDAMAYEQLMRTKVPNLQFDLIMLGMGEDGHTASLFPYTHGLHTKDRLIIANYIPQKQAWRLSMTYECLNQAKTICIYVMGAKKTDMVAKCLLGPYDPDLLPVQRVGTPTHKAIWILDQAAAAKLLQATGTKNH